MAGAARGSTPRGYPRGADLDPLEDRIRPFVLKKGHMATVSANRDGTGASRVYIAADRDLDVDPLPSSLQSSVSAVRVVRWVHAPKKGVCTVNNPDFRVALVWSAADVDPCLLVAGVNVLAVEMLGCREPLRWRAGPRGLTVTLLEEKPCSHAYVLRVRLK